MAKYCFRQKFLGGPIVEAFQLAKGIWTPKWYLDRLDANLIWVDPANNSRIYIKRKTGVQIATEGNYLVLDQDGEITAYTPFEFITKYVEIFESHESAITLTKGMVSETAGCGETVINLSFQINSSIHSWESCAEEIGRRLVEIAEDGRKRKNVR